MKKSKIIKGWIVEWKLSKEFWVYKDKNKVKNFEKNSPDMRFIRCEIKLLK